MAVGSVCDDGYDNTKTDSGAIYLYTFDDSQFTGGTLQGIIGNGYTGGKNINQAFDNNDEVHAVSLDNNCLAVGAPGDDGLNNNSADAGAVYIYTFTDENFSGGTLERIIGSGYTGGLNIDVTSDFGNFGIDVSLNSPNLDVAAGNVYLFRSVDMPPQSNNLNYYMQPTEDVTISNFSLDDLLSTPQNVSLQANNDLFVYDPITAINSSGSGGALSLQAGRSVYINANVTTDNANLTIIGNETLANGVIDTQRDAGNAVILMAPGTIIDAGTGNVTIDLRNGAGKTNTGGGDISLNEVYGNDIYVVNALGNILDNKADETPNIYGRNITLVSSSGTVGTSAEDLNIYVNYLTSGGYLTAAAYNGIINLEQYEGNLDVNYIVSKQDVTVKAAGNILDQRDNETGNIYGKNIFLSSSNGSIGTSAEDLNIYVNYLTSGGYLTAIAYNGIINLEQYEGNLDVNYIVSKQDVTVKAAGNILDQRNNETGNIYGKNIFLSSSNGSIGTSAEDLNIYVNYLTSGGYLTAAAYNGIINLEQYEGNLDVNYIVSKQDVTVKAAGNILDQRNNETGNIYGKNIFLSSNNGSIGTSAEDLNIYVNYLTSGWIFNCHCLQRYY